MLKESAEYNMSLLKMFNCILEEINENDLQNHLKNLLNQKSYKNLNKDFSLVFTELIKKFIRCFGLNLLNWNCSGYLLDRIIIKYCASESSIHLNLFILLTGFICLLIELKESVFDCEEFQSLLGKPNNN